MSSVVLFGTGSSILVDVEESLHRAGVGIAAGVCNRKAGSYLSIPALRPDELSPEMSELPFLIPLFTPENRYDAFIEAKQSGLKHPFTLVDPSVAGPRKLSADVGTFINAGCSLGAASTFGAFVFINRSASIGHHVRLGPFVSIGPGVVIGGHVVVGAGAMIGAGATILPLKTIGENAIVGAGAVVTHDVPAGATVIGNPARIVRGDRDDGGRAWTEAVPRTAAEPPSDAAQQIPNSPQPPPVSQTLTLPRTVMASAQRGREPTVSVLIKSYNHASYVRMTIESVLAQTFQDFEIIVTDDGSTDATADILRSFTDRRIDLAVSASNEGISAAMNATIARARGRYLAILNSDDWALPDRLQRQVEFLDGYPEVSLVFGLPRPVDELGRPTAARDAFEQALAFSDFSRRTWLRFFFFHHNILCAPTAMIRRDAYERVGRYDRRLTNLQDLDMWVRMLIAGCNIHVMDEELTALRIRDANANMSAPRRDTRLRVAYETTKILKHYRDLEPDDFETLFSEEALANSNLPVPLRIAELALRLDSAPHRHFGLETIYEFARTRDDYERLRELTGSLDLVGIEHAAATATETSGAHSSLGRRSATATYRTWFAKIRANLGKLAHQIPF